MMKHIRMIVDIENCMDKNNLSEKDSVGTLIDTLDSKSNFNKKLNQYVLNNEVTENDSVEQLIEVISKKDKETFLCE